MVDAFDTVEEYWGHANVAAALGTALNARTDVVAEFEAAFASFVGGSDAAFMANGRGAIYQALQILGVRKGDEVILPAFICSVVADAVLRCSATPVLVDVEMPTGAIDLGLVLKALTVKTKAVLIPHLFGVPVDFRAIKEELQRRDVAIIEDCAHCLGGSVVASSVGTLGAFSVFSFNYDKPISLGNGGMLVCAGSQWLNAFRAWKAQGSCRSPSDIRDEYEEMMAFLGHLGVRRGQIRQTLLPGRLAVLKSRLLQYRCVSQLRVRLRPDAQSSTLRASDRVGAVRAALGLSLLKRYQAIAHKRNQNAAYLLGLIQDLHWAEASVPASHIRPMTSRVNVFASGLSTRQVDYVGAKLCQAGFRAGRFNWPFSLDQIPYLRRRVRLGSKLSNARRMAGHCLNLPIHQRMNKDDLDTMARMLVSIGTEL